MTPLLALLTLATYLTLFAGVGWFTSRKANSSDYYRASGTTRWYTATAAMITAAMSGITFVSVPGSVINDGFTYMQMVFGFTLGQLVIAFLLIPLFYRLRVVSLYQYLEQRFGLYGQRSGAWIFFVSKVVIVSLRLLVLTLVTQQLIFDHYSIPFFVNVALSMLFVFAATRYGGVKSLIWTDILKTVILLSSVALTALFIGRTMNISLFSLVEEVQASAISNVFILDDPASSRYFWKMLAAGLFTLVAMTGLDQDMMQCNLSCVNRRDAQINIVLTALIQMVVIYGLLMLGAMLYQYAAWANLPLSDRADETFSLVAFSGALHPVVGLLFILGISATTFGSVASALTALTTTLVVDLVPEKLRRDEDTAKRTRLIGHAALTLMIIALVMLVGGVGNESIINKLYKFVGYAYGPILGLFTFGLATKLEVRDRFIPAVVVSSLLLIIAIEWFVNMRFGYTIGFELLIYNAALTFTGMALISKSQGAK